jgi:predicted methyltransferase
VHRFERASDWVAEFDDPARDAWQRPDEVVASLRIVPGMTVADVGAGTGYFEGRLSRAVGASGVVLAVDIEPDMVRHLGERAQREQLSNVKPLLAKGDDPGLAPASVDRVLIVDTWHHIPERAAYAAKLRAALKPGGQVAIVDFTETAEHGPPRHHRLPPAQVLAELRAAGLEAELSGTQLPEQYIAVGSLR